MKLVLRSETFIHLRQTPGELNRQSLMSVVKQTVERLGRIKQEVNELRSQLQVQVQREVQYCRKYQKRHLKVGSPLW